MAAPMIVSVSPDAFSNNGCTEPVKQELTEETEVLFFHLRSLCLLLLKSLGELTGFGFNLTTCLAVDPLINPFWDPAADQW